MSGAMGRGGKKWAQPSRRVDKSVGDLKAGELWNLQARCGVPFTTSVEGCGIEESISY